MKNLITGICICGAMALASCGHKTDANNVTDTAATSPGISTDSGKMHDSSAMRSDSSTMTDTAKGGKTDSATASKHLAQ